MRFFMIDYLEFNLRRVMVDNTHFCAEKCSLYDDLRPNSTLPEKTQGEEKKLFSCFEKCLGKFSDSYENALDIFGSHLKTLQTNQVFKHSESQSENEAAEKRFLLG